MNTKIKPESLEIESTSRNKQISSSFQVRCKRIVLAPLFTSKKSENIFVKTADCHVDSNISKHEYKTIVKEEDWDFGQEFPDEFVSKHLLFQTEVEKIQKKIQREEEQEEARERRIKDCRFQIFFYSSFALVFMLIMVIAEVKSSSFQDQQNSTMSDTVNGTQNFAATTPMHNESFF